MSLRDSLGIFSESQFRLSRTLAQRHSQRSESLGGLVRPLLTPAVSHTIALRHAQDASDQSQEVASDDTN